MQSRQWRYLAFLASAALFLGACSSDGDHDAHNSGAGSEGEMPGVVPGEPASASDADRTIDVSASDELSFDPESIEVEAGEVITFSVTNDGNIDHEFVLGDESYQKDHEMAMSEGMEHGSEDDSAVPLPPGDTAELTWRFTESGEVQFACHVAGHYEGGMFGTVTVQ